MAQKFRRKKRTKRGKKTKKGPVDAECEELVRAPHSFVIHRGQVGSYCVGLTKDLRKVMEPFTASSVQVKKRNSVKDFVAVSGPLHVSHLLIVTNTQVGPSLRIMRTPKGPTLTFRIHSYSLCQDILSSVKKQLNANKMYKHPPLIVLNNFTSDENHMKLMATMFQNMFPTINVTKVNLSDIKRVVMINYNTTSKLIDFRHYGIRVVPIGVSKGVKKILQSKVPNLARFQDMSEFLTKPGMLSESEVEDDPNSHVTLPQTLSSRGNLAQSKSSVRLFELGPRMTLQLIKVEEGLMDGEVMFHELVHKTEEEKRAIQKRITQRKRLKEERKRVQEQNKKRKEQLKEDHKQKSLAGMKKKQTELDSVMKQNRNDEASETVDDDVQYYREEVGEEPQEELFDPNKAQVKFRPPKLSMKRKSPYSRKDGNNTGNKKFKRGGNDDRGPRKGGKKFGGSDRGPRKKVLGSKIKKKSKRN
uniref:Suppressor of SWI4 1 homolog n=1 Tax=Cacopsylla melanoneura TaxID=428564 RepID=A0A8D8RCF5_9HEMI